MALVVTIAGTDRTSVTDFDNLVVTQVADSYTFTAEIHINDRDSDITIVAGSHKAADEITIVQDAVTFFGGFVDDIDFNCQEDGSRQQHLHCIGYGVLLGETTVEYEEYDVGEAARTDKWIINDIFTTYLAAIDASTAAVVELADPLDILFEEMTVDEIMTAICNRTGGRFYVDNSKVLHYFSAETADAGFDLSDTPNDVTSFGYFDRPEKARTGGNIINKARIIGADGYTATRTDAASQAAYGVQGAIVTDPTLFCTAELNERGDDVLADQKDPRDKYVVSTTHAGAVAGDLIDFKCVDLGYNSTGLGGEDPQLVIRELHIRWQQGDPVYQMTLGELEYSSVSKSKAVATQVKSLVLALGKAGRQQWGHSLLFSATDQNTVAWAAAGKIASSDGNTVYIIDAGNTGNMDQTTYVYLDIDNSITALVSSTNIEVVFAKKNVILIATCHPVAAGLAEFQIMFGGHATPGGTAVHDHSDADAGDVNVRPDRIGVHAAVANQDGVLALGETVNPVNVAAVGMLYAKDDAGTTRMYFMRDDGTILELGVGAGVVSGVTKTVKGAGGDFTTIQAAINWFKNKLLGGTNYIDIDAGTYAETIIFTDLFIRGEDVLTLRGDTRVVAGLSYAGSGLPRGNSTAYAVGNTIFVSDPAGDQSVPPRTFECTTAGTSGAAPPGWDGTIHNTTADGTVTWTCRSATYANRAGLANGGQTAGWSGLYYSAGSIYCYVYTDACALSSPDFDADGWGAGDTILVLDSGGITEYAVTNVVNERIYINIGGGAPAADFGRDGTAICLLPNRRITKAAAGTVVTATGANITLDGFYLYNSGTGANCMAFRANSKSVCKIHNCCARAEDYGYRIEDPGTKLNVSSGAVSVWGTLIGFYCTNFSYIGAYYVWAVGNTYASISQTASYVGRYAQSIKNSSYGWFAYRLCNVDVGNCQVRQSTTGFYIATESNMLASGVLPLWCGVTTINSPAGVGFIEGNYNSMLEVS